MSKYEIVRPGNGPLLGHYKSRNRAEAVCQALNEKIIKKRRRASREELRPFLYYVREVADGENHTKAKTGARG